MSDFDVEQFSEQVFQEFEFLKMTKTIKYPSEAVSSGANKNAFGCLFVPILRFFDGVGKKEIEKEKRRKKHFENERYAETILLRADIKIIVCDAVERFSKKEILTEAKFVETITETLVGKVSEGKFTIPFEPVLFAAMAYKISETGIEEFCASVSDEQ